MTGNRERKSGTFTITIAGALMLLGILFFGTVWMGNNARQDTEAAVRSVSLLYLDELAGRREQVVAENLQDNIERINTALELLNEEDLSDEEHLKRYQFRMRQLFHLEKFAFVDADGHIYTSSESEDDISTYQFDYRTITTPEISVKNLDTPDKKAIIAVPVNHVRFGDKELVVCFMEIDMDEMLRGVSMQSQENGSTFCNIYTSQGVPLSNTVLGGLAVEDNLLGAMTRAIPDKGYSYDQLVDDFAAGRKGVISFTYNGIQETLSYVPVEGTDWLLTYLIRESVISEQIGSITDSIIRRSILQSLLSVGIMLLVFGYIFRQNRHAARLQLDKETAAAASRAKQEELEHRLALQEKLLAEERQREEQDRLITALASDYWSVYYLELDKDAGVCYQAHADVDGGLKAGERFPYLKTVTNYANQYITEPYRQQFLAFVQPDAIREGLKKNRVLSYTYMVRRHDRESYEMVKFAGVRQADDANDHLVHTVGACFTDVDEETRKNIAQNQALSDALENAEQANRAKTAFLSNMSHEIRTPMNAIIGLDNIALNDPDVPPKTRDYLEKIGNSAEHLLGLINDILDMSRIESGRMVLKKEEFSFPKLLESINTMFSGQCAAAGLDYQCHIDGEVDSHYIGDSGKLRQVLINILGNAVKFTPAGGRVDLDVTRLNQFDGQTTLQFKITDTGIGMSKEFLPHIFETFAQEDSSSTSKYGSTGLGMPITKNIVEMMNGDIQVESEKGKGSTFTVSVTLMDSQNKEPESGNEDEIRLQDMTVLIVDDDPVACEHGQLVLQKAGISAETVSSGAEAIEHVKLRQARRDPYNLILVDWQMPEMDGVETTRRIRELVGNDSAIIILTAYRWDDVLEEALAAGVDSFIAKPLFAATLLDELREVLKRKGMRTLKQEHKAELTGRRVLLAEDVQINAEIMMMLLQTKQIQAELAENGRIAVEMFEQHPAGYYDAILMDMRMPEMDGLEATRVIRAMDRPDAGSIPIIALTANAFDEDVQRSMQAGLNAHLTKPVEPEVLFDTLAGLIRD